MHIHSHIIIHTHETSANSLLLQAWMDIGPITSPRKVLTASIMFIHVAQDCNTASKVTSAYIAAQSKPHNQ